MKDREQPGEVEMEIPDYGGSQSYEDREIARKSGRDIHAYGDRTDGGPTGGSDFGTGAAEAAGRGGDTEDRQRAYLEQYEDTSANAGVGEFGEWDNSGLGTDLTEMMETPKPRSDRPGGDDSTF